MMGCPLLVFKKTTCRCLVNGTRTHCMPKGKCGNGNLIDLEIIVQKIDYHGKEGILGVLQDITEIRHTEDKIQRFNEELKMAITEKTFDLEEANKRLRSLNELKDEFIAVTSHELRSPLTTIRGYLSFLTDEEHLKTMPEQDQQYLIRAYNNVDVLNNLVNNILDVSRLESGRFQLKKTSVNLVTLIKNIIDNLAIHLRSGKLRIIFNNKTQQKQFTIHVDNVRIHQVLMNVLENAIKYSKSNKDIVVDLEKDGKKALIRITNHGVGIPRSQIKYIFDKFIQGKNATTRYKGGAGLGLFIVKRIVELHGGKISVQSHPKKGTVFTIQFPIS